MSSDSTGGRLYVISAPSGAGKTSLTHAVIARLTAHRVPVSFSVSHTTRAPRPGERDGIDYHFVSEQQFATMVEAGAFLEYARVFDRCYGTARARTEALLREGRDVVLDIDWQGARQVRERMPEAVSIFILPPSREELERRLRLRAKDDHGAIEARMRRAADEISHYQEYDYLVVNEDFERAVVALEAVFLSARLRREFQAPRLAPMLERLLADGPGTG